MNDLHIRWRMTLAKLTVSLTESARQRIEERSAELGLTRSGFVERLVAADAQAEFECLLEEGYRATSEQNLDFAERALPLAWELIEHAGPAW